MDKVNVNKNVHVLHTAGRAKVRTKRKIKKEAPKTKGDPVDISSAKEQKKDAPAKTPVFATDVKTDEKGKPVSIKVTAGEKSGDAPDALSTVTRDMTGISDNDYKLAEQLYNRANAKPTGSPSNTGDKVVLQKNGVLAFEMPVEQKSADATPLGKAAGQPRFKPQMSAAEAMNKVNGLMLGGTGGNRESSAMSANDADKIAEDTLSHMKSRGINFGKGVNKQAAARGIRVMDQSMKVLKNNRVTINGHTFTTPSKVVEDDSHLDYEGKQWLWDSAFHAMIMADSEPEVAKEELRSVVANQHEDGFVPHMNYFRGDAQNVPDWTKPHFDRFLKSPDGKDIPPEKKAHFTDTYWSYKDHSDITQPPIIAEAVHVVASTTGDRKFVKEMLPKLKGYYNYLHDKRDPDNDGLVSIIHPWESGWDNSQRWDPVIGKTDGQRNHIDEKKMHIFCCHKKDDWDLDKIFENDKFNVEPVAFNVLYARNMRALSDLCKQEGDNDGAKLYENRAKRTEKAIVDRMWDGEKFVDLYGKDEKKSDVSSAAMFYPMMLEGAPHSKELIEGQMMDPEKFNTKYSLPTTSRDHHNFDGSQYWRGNVWLSVNHFVGQALKNVIKENPDYTPAKMMYSKISDSSFEVLDKEGFSEYFNPDKADGHGVKTFGWNGMVRYLQPLDAPYEKQDK